MTSQPPPSDTDRIIAAQREEARRTRTLLVWIFVGLPVAGLAAWGIVAVANSGPALPTTPDTSVSSTPDAGALSLESTCQQLNNATTAVLHNFDETWPEVADEADANCTAHPDWTINEAIAPPAATPPPANENVLDQAVLQQGVKQILNDAYKDNASDVSCPAAEPVTVGNTFDCTATIANQTVRVPVTVKDINGAYEVGEPR